MARKLLLPILIVAIFIAILGFLVKRSQTNVAQKTLVFDKKEILVKQARIIVDIADTEPKRTLGLGGRDSLRNDGGMLFIFPTTNFTPTFWMKGMLIPIDILWIKDNKIVQISSNLQPPEANIPDARLKLYYPAKPIDYVLEVNANFSEAFLIKVGDSVDLSSVIKQ
jgi:uncharacterized protein